MQPCLDTLKRFCIIFWELKTKMTGAFLRSVSSGRLKAKQSMLKTSHLLQLFQNKNFLLNPVRKKYVNKITILTG
jgi:hypothetical protein